MKERLSSLYGNTCTCMCSLICCCGAYKHIRSSADPLPHLFSSPKLLVVMNSLRELSMKTSILSDPSKVPQQLSQYCSDAQGRQSRTWNAETASTRHAFCHLISFVYVCVCVFQSFPQIMVPFFCVSISCFLNLQRALSLFLSLTHTRTDRAPWQSFYSCTKSYWPLLRTWSSVFFVVFFSYFMYSTS